jgi:hypothetical protein
MQLSLEHNKSTAQIAAALSVNERSVRHWLAGTRIPRLTIEQSQALCRLFNCSIFDIPTDFRRKIS